MKLKCQLKVNSFTRSYEYESIVSVIRLVYCRYGEEHPVA